MAKQYGFGKWIERAINQFAWLIVVVAALSLSGWSLFFVGRHYGLPVSLAVIVSAAFDGSAIVCAELALRYARSAGDSGLAPRIVVFIMAGLSAYLNSQHATLAHDPSAARILYAVPPIVAVVVFELHSRFERKAALKRAGRVAQSLPVFGKWAWVLFPIRTLGTVRRLVAFRVSRASNEVPEDFVIKGATDAGRAFVESEQEALPEPKLVRAWAIGRGMEISDRGRIPGYITAAYVLDSETNRRHNQEMESVKPETSALTGPNSVTNQGTSDANPSLTGPIANITYVPPAQDGD
jgi:hypothetical protein